MASVEETPEEIPVEPGSSQNQPEDYASPTVDDYLSLPPQVQVLFANLSTSQRNERYAKGLCFSCGKPGHISKDCPDKKQTARATFTVTDEPPALPFDESGNMGWA